MKTLHMLAISEAAALALSMAVRLHDAIPYTIVGMMIVTFGYMLENALAGKKSFAHSRKIIVFAMFAAVIAFYWLFKII